MSVVNSEFQRLPMVPDTYMFDNHIERIKNNECDLTHGATFERIVNDLERIGDHLTFIGRSIIEVAHTN